MDEFAFKVVSHVSFVVVVIVVGFAYIGCEAAATVVLPEEELQSEDAEYGEDEGEERDDRHERRDGLRHGDEDHFDAVQASHALQRAKHVKGADRRHVRETRNQ